MPSPPLPTPCLIKGIDAGISCQYLLGKGLYPFPARGEEVGKHALSTISILILTPMSIRKERGSSLAMRIQYPPLSILRLGATPQITRLARLLPPFADQCGDLGQDLPLLRQNVIGDFQPSSLQIEEFTGEVF